MNNWLLKLKSNLYPILLFIIFIVGIYLRLKFYIINYPLWHDECSLALSIINKNIFGYFGILEHNQSAPPIFMMISKLCSSIFGMKEYGLRFFPFLCGILSIPVFYKFSKLFINKKWLLLLANFLFAINYHLIHYSIEFKQYSSDVLLFMVVFILCLNINLPKINTAKAFIFGICGLLLSLISLPTVFVMAGFCLYQLIKYKKSILKNITFILLPFLILGSLYFYYTLLPQQTSIYSVNESYYNNGFISFNLIQICKLLKVNLPYYLYPNRFVLFDIILIVAGIYHLIKNLKNKAAIFLTICLSGIILASLFRVYPIYQRVSLYLVPIILILIVLPASYISLNKKIYSGLILLFMWLSLCGYNLSYVKSFLGNDLYKRNNARTTMQILKEKYQNSDSYIIVNAASDSEFKYYKTYFNFNANKIIYIQAPEYSKTKYFSILEMLPSENNYWFYYANDFSHSPVIPFLREWSQEYQILYKEDIDGAYILNINKKPAS